VNEGITIHTKWSNEHCTGYSLHFFEVFITDENNNEDIVFFSSLEGLSNQQIKVVVEK